MKILIINFQSVEQQLRGVKMEIKQNWTPIRLKAIDDQDLQIFSQFLYESIVLPSEIKFEEKNQQFAMAIERFTWEHAKNESHLLMQVLSILVINYVEKAELKNIFYNYKIKNILSISNIDNNKSINNKFSFHFLKGLRTRDDGRVRFIIRQLKSLALRFKNFY